MPVWALSILGFLGKRSLHFIVYAIIALAIWGIYHKIFVSPTTTSTSTTTVQDGGKVVNVYNNENSSDQEVPMFGCAAWRINNKTYWKKAIPVIKK